MNRNKLVIMALIVGAALIPSTLILNANAQAVDCWTNTIFYWAQFDVAIKCLDDRIDGIGAGTPTELDDLTDVIVVNPQTNEILRYNGTHWINVSSGAVVTQLDDLSDVTIINPTTSQILEYNGTQWVNVDHVVYENNTASNLGSASSLSEGLFAQKNGVDLEFKRLLEGSNIALSSNSTHVTIAVTGITSESTACSNTGSGNGLCNGGNVNIKSLIAGTGITITDTSDDWTLASQCSSTGSGEAVCESANNINSLIAGNSLTIADTTGDLTITPTLQKLCETTAAGSETTLTCTLSSSQQFLYIVMGVSYDTDTNTVFRMRFNGDSGSNYALRSSVNGGADATSVNQAGIIVLPASSPASQPIYHWFTCYDYSSSVEKACSGERTSVAASGAGSAPSRVELVLKWANTSNDITSVSIERTAGTGVMQSGNFIAVWGYS